MGKIIALTGAAGYLGSVLIDYLGAQSWVERIIAVDVKPLPLHPQTVYDGRLISYYADIHDGDFMRAIFVEHGVTNVIHAAFIPSQQGGVSISQMRTSNIDGSQRLFHAAFETHVRQILFLSSASTYGYHHGNPFGIREENEPRPSTVYANHKVLVEQYLNAEQLNYPQTRTAVLRSVAVVGPQGRTMSPWRALTAQKVFLLSNGGHARTQAIHEQDIAALIGRIVEQNSAGTFNAGPDDHASWAEIGKLTGLPVISAPRGVLNFATRFNTILPPLHSLTREVVDMFSETLVCSNSAVRSQVGWAPHYTTREAFGQLFGASIKTRELSSV
jgi:nucleoside-diphosphate-sugar epimerase